MKASVVVPTFARPRPLAQCLEALAAQDLAGGDYEVVVVDDGGPADLEPLLATWRAHLDVRLVRRRRGGPAAARNSGLAAARGEVVACTDDDCRPAPDWLRRMRDAVRATPGCLAGGRTVNGLPHNPCSSASQLIIDLVYAYYNADPRRPRLFAANNIAARAADLRAMGGFDARFVTSEDRELCERWRHEGRPLAYVSEAVVSHAHDLTLGGFLRQHFGYGRGAALFHESRRRRGSSRLADHTGFHLRLPALLLPRLRGLQAAAALRLCGLLVLWQAANAVGAVAGLADTNLGRAYLRRR
ncbi:MAG TPA: glycosyltransferase [Vicinamibacteria bacterium]|nr:glycosyltransferase [Vicinamibacteria bacterium]